MHNLIECQSCFEGMIGDIKIQSRVLAIDCEFDRRTTFYPNLSLIQICDGKKIWIIDGLKIKKFDSLKKILEDESIIKVFHSGQQDYELLHQHCNILTSPIFDTQIMASFLGYGIDPSLEKMSQQALNLPLDKQYQDADWMIRPLTHGMLEYASNDVKTVFNLYNFFLTINDYRKTWAMHEMAKGFNLAQANPHEWLKLIPVKPSIAEAYILEKLCAWRQNYAEKLNIPKTFIFKNGIFKNRQLFSLGDSVVKFEKVLQQSKLDSESFEKLKKQYMGWCDEAICLPKSTEKNIAEILNEYFSANDNRRLKSEIKDLKDKLNFLSAKHNIPAHYILAKKNYLKYLHNQDEFMSDWQKELLKETI